MPGIMVERKTNKALDCLELPVDRGTGLTSIMILLVTPIMVKVSAAEA